MDNSNIKESVKGIIEGLLKDYPEDFLVDIKVKPGNNIQILLDGDFGISIEKCVLYHRALYKKIEENLFPSGNFSLEISSFGIDEPLKMHRQYKKNIGRQVEVIFTDGTKKEGRLSNVTEDEITLDKTKQINKKKEVAIESFPFNNIKTTKVQIVF